ncbi:hypothetical protein [Spirosoma endbachense]|uniref:Uncharacterized protein n=1 Tax=Spirosoma endbachense TaxID=2666025 RepID=A0A6P1VU11_9BACT|nr:hypothetical protein [Spirosoma endbachense]QHV96104.1 hypothetical protein GJR95_14285 [Spirosoma endbachense]
MKKQVDTDKEQLAKPIGTDNSGTPESDQVHYPDPSDGIPMHIEELKENLEAIKEETGIDPNLLPEIEQE